MASQLGGKNSGLWVRRKVTIVLYDNAMEVLALWRSGRPEGMIVFQEDQELLSFPPIGLQMEMREDCLRRVVNLGRQLARLAVLLWSFCFTSHVWLDTGAMAPCLLSRWNMSMSQGHLTTLDSAVFRRPFYKMPAVDLVVMERGLWCFNLLLLLMILQCPVMNILWCLPWPFPLCCSKSKGYLPEIFSGLSV